MPSLYFTSPDDPMLQMRATDVPVDQINSVEVQELIDAMLIIARGERTDLGKRILVGLAAPQVGIPKRIIIVDVGNDASRQNLGKLQVYINPVLLWASQEQEAGREGCFSTGHIHAVVPRATKVRISAYDRNGKQVIEEHEGFTARVFQHEIDHLEGIRFPDRIGPEGRLLWVDDEDYEDYRANWESWPKVCPFSTWLKMRG